MGVCLIDEQSYDLKYCEDAVIVDMLPEGDLADYRLDAGAFIYDPLPETEEVPTQLDKIEAQLIYTAMMTDTLLEE